MANRRGGACLARVWGYGQGDELSLEYVEFRCCLWSIYEETTGSNESELVTVVWVWSSSS